jgi:2-polyprenyl-6-methoxyphenol hydroxylase-like FAD-dependent oxidoreductase
MPDQAAKPRIAIVGGGPGGLTLARILYVHGVPSVVFERETHFGERPQGGSLDLHHETGQFALRSAGLESSFQRVARYEDQGVRIADKHGRILFDDQSNEGNRPEVDRAHLRQILLESLPPASIRWDHAVKHAQACPDGTYELLFDNKSVPEGFDLIIGADGTWSKIRPLVSAVRPQYEGILFAEFHLADIGTKHPELAQLLGHGKFLALGDSKGILAQRNANGHLYGYAAFHAPEPSSPDLGSSSSPALLKSTLLDHFAGWSDDLLAFLHQSDDQVIPRPLSFLPPGHSWKNRPGVTLLGDAAHVMSPFSGEGANLAMRGAADLALALAAGSDWKLEVRQFERIMCDRAAIAATDALEAMRDVFSEHGLDDAVEQFKSHHPHTASA